MRRHKMPEAMMTYDEFVTHNNHIDNLATRWLKDRIKFREVDELWCAIGDGFAEVLWDVGASQEPVNEALERELIDRHWADIFDYVEAIAQKDRENGTYTL